MSELYHNIDIDGCLIDTDLYKMVSEGRGPSNLKLTIYGLQCHPSSKGIMVTLSPCFQKINVSASMERHVCGHVIRCQSTPNSPLNQRWKWVRVGSIVHLDIDSNGAAHTRSGWEFRQAQIIIHHRTAPRPKFSMYIQCCISFNIGQASLWGPPRCMHYCKDSVIVVREFKEFFTAIYLCD